MSGQCGFDVRSRTLLLALLTGLAPALRAKRADVATHKAPARGSACRSSRLRTRLLLVQAALAVILLIGAGLFVRSFANVRALRLGYDVDPTIHVARNLRGEALDSVAIRSGGNPAVSGRIFPELNHLFVPHGASDFDHAKLPSLSALRACVRSHSGSTPTYR